MECGRALLSCKSTPSVLVVYFAECLCLQDFSGDFSDLDGVVQQRRQDMTESSSSGSQTPDYDKISGVCSLFVIKYHRPHLDFLWSSCFERFQIS